jgi:hypothetical protein
MAGAPRPLMRLPPRSSSLSDLPRDKAPDEQSAKTTLFADGNAADVRKMAAGRRRPFFQ